MRIPGVLSVLNVLSVAGAPRVLGWSRVAGSVIKVRQPLDERPRRAQTPVGVVFPDCFRSCLLLRYFAAAVGALRKVLVGAVEGGGGQFVVDKRGDRFVVEVVDGIERGHGCHLARMSSRAASLEMAWASSDARSWLRPRWMRERTVPILTPSVLAISS